MDAVSGREIDGLLERAYGAPPDVIARIRALVK